MFPKCTQTKITILGDILKTDNIMAYLDTNFNNHDV